MKIDLSFLRNKKIMISLLILFFIFIGFIFLKFNVFDKNNQQNKNIVQEVKTDPDNIFLNGINIGMSKDEVLKKITNPLENEEKYIISEFKEIGNGRFLPVYIFDNNILKGIVLERELDETSRLNLSKTHQDFSNEINKILIGYNFVENNQWKKSQPKSYDMNLWNKEIEKENLELTNVWVGKENKYVFISKRLSDYDFLIYKNKSILNNSQTLVISNQNEDISQFANIEVKNKELVEEIKGSGEDIFKNAMNENSVENELGTNANRRLTILSFNKKEEGLVLMNTSGKELDISGYYVRTLKDMNEYVFPEGYKLKNKEAVLLTGKDGSSNIKSNITKIVNWSTEEIFNDNGDGIEVYSNEDKLIDSTN